LEDHAASIFRVGVHDEWKADGQGMRRGRGNVGYSVSKQKAWEESALNRAIEKGKAIKFAGWSQ
jgi:hypothetical protein